MRHLSTYLLLFAALQSLGAPTSEDEAREVDKSLNAVYEGLTAALSADQKESIRQLQLAWIRLRDKTCALESAMQRTTPGDWISQSAHPAVDLQCITRLTRSQTVQLKGYLGYARRNASSPGAASEPSAPAEQRCAPLDLPAAFTVQAVGVNRGGIETDVHVVDAGESDTGAVDVVVNRPAENVVLVLIAHDPVLWSVERTPETNIVAVILGGYYAQAVVGISRAIPLVRTSYASPLCSRYVYEYKALRDANALVEQLTGGEIDQLWSQETGQRIYVGARPLPGTELQRSDDYRPEDFTSLPRAAQGTRAFERLIAQGKLRRVTAQDIDAWMTKARVRIGPGFDPEFMQPVGQHGEYVVLGAMQIPTGLELKSYAFLIPTGVPVPTGNIERHRIFFLETGECEGMECPHL